MSSRKLQTPWRPAPESLAWFSEGGRARSMRVARVTDDAVALRAIAANPEDLTEEFLPP